MASFSTQFHLSLSSASKMNAYKDRLRQPDPISCDDITNFHKNLFHESNMGESEAAGFLFDKSHTLHSVVQRLYRAAFLGIEEECLLSTNGASKVRDKETKEVLFYSKTSFLSEELGVPKDEAIGREHLYYLLDHHGFAGVPPTFRVQLTKQKIRSFQWFKKNCNWWSDRTEDKKIALRKCVIHQFRTVNMDPSSPNILIPQGSNSVVFPIDGGYCLPESLSDKRRKFDVADNPPLVEKPYLDEPFTAEEKTYIDNIEIDKDKELIRCHLGKNSQKQVLKIFQAANLILKRAVEKSKNVSLDTISITLHDLCNIRDLRSHHLYPLTSLFEHILEGDEKFMVDRIDNVFNEIIKIKNIIRTNKDCSPEQLTLKLFDTIDKHNHAMRNIVAHYTLGGKNLCKYIFSENKGDLEIQLRKIQ